MSERREDGGPAFPAATWMAMDNDGNEHLMQLGEIGMSLRDYFAGQVLIGMHIRDTFDEGLATPKQRARAAYLDADAMIAARAEPKP